MSAYECLIFDADGTLFDFDRSEKIALEKTCLQFNLPYHEATHLDIYKTINTAIWQEREENRITAEALKPERFRRFLTAIDSKADPRTMSSYYLQSLSEMHFLLDGAWELVAQLRKTFRLALVTNGLSSVQHPRFRNSGLYQFFEAFVVSEDIGIAKPDPEILQYTFEKMGITKKNSAMIIGDNLSSDIQAGLNFGIDSCWYNPSQKANTGKIRPTFEIKSFTELQKIID